MKPEYIHLVTVKYFESMSLSESMSYMRNGLVLTELYGIAGV